MHILYFIVIFKTFILEFNDVWLRVKDRTEKNWIYQQMEAFYIHAKFHMCCDFTQIIDLVYDNIYL